jgi:hypothetical protein
MLLLPRPIVRPRKVDAVRRRSLALLLVATLLSSTTVPAFAKAPKTSDPELIKRKVEKLGVGEHVAVKRLAEQTLHGHITAIGEQSFKLHADNATSETEIAYDQVLNVKKNPGPVMWMVLGAVLLVVIVVAVKH